MAECLGSNLILELILTNGKVCATVPRSEQDGTQQHSSRRRRNGYSAGSYYQIAGGHGGAQGGDVRKDGEAHRRDKEKDQRHEELLNRVRALEENNQASGAGIQERVKTPSQTDEEWTAIERRLEEDERRERRNDLMKQNWRWKHIN
ncbi:hypothetical protein QAD02_002097 [Eretmocerus hayati]|uniref:Uncharacterized protein n=1 Tax=Eretmocerus hayati TaxID=131215 RepID=A0ACC2NI45_9HYME|nr:hypothetical protein QAD02_002097 [Eretmocerus hayati]